jgi:RHS repeat-associated protein
MYNKQAQKAAAQIGSMLGFNGERNDPVLGNYHLGNGYRMYNPALRRFTSPDSMSPFGAGGINSYSYCADDPINNTDPTGHVGMSMIGGLYLPDLLEGLSWSLDMINYPVMAQEEIGRGDTNETSHVLPRGNDVPGSSAPRTVDDEAIPAKRARQSARASMSLQMVAGSSGLTRSTFPDSDMRASVLASPKRMDYIADPTKFIHHFLSYGEVASADKSTSYKSHFLNRYEPSMWELKFNFRDKCSPYYTSDVIRYQYDKVSSVSGFNTERLRVIKWNTVINQETLDVLNNGGDFFSSPLGKSTRNILDEFKLEYTGYTTNKSGKYMDIVVGVKKMG